MPVLLRFITVGAVGASGGGAGGATAAAGGAGTPAVDSALALGASKSTTGRDRVARRRVRMNVLEKNELRDMNQVSWRSRVQATPETTRELSFKIVVQSVAGLHRPARIAPAIP